MSPSEHQAEAKPHSFWVLVASIGTLALVLGIVGELSGLFRFVSSPLRSELTQWAAFEGGLVPVSPLLRYGYLAGSAYLTSAALLLIGGAWRQLLCWLVAGLLTMSFCCVLIFFGRWFDPVGALAAGLWSGLGSIYHLAHLKKLQHDPTKLPAKTEVAPEEDGLDELDGADEWEEFRSK